MDRARDMLRSGDWLTRERIRLVAIALLMASVIGFLYLVVTAHGAVDRQGRPLGTDFSNVYAAGTYVNEGNPTAPFDLAQQSARERAIFGDLAPFYPWPYPPFFLFAAAVLALMPYGLALAVWQAATLGLYLLTMRAILTPARQPSAEAAGASADGLWLLVALAFPAVLINVGHGQNGFLTAALLGGALLMLDRRPLMAGILFGLLVYKPQYGLMIPLVLAVSGRWRCFAAAAATVVLLTVATLLTFGVAAWRAFFVSMEFARTVGLEQGNTGWYKFQSVFAWARMWGAPIAPAYAVQGAVIVALAAALAWLWRSAAPYPLKAAALCLATILATPYSFDYDMTVLAPVIAFLVVDGFARGFGPWERTALAALWLVPLFARSVAEATFIPLGVPVMLALFALILHRAGLRGAVPRLFATVAFPGRSSTMDPVSGGTSRDQELRHDIASLKS